MVDSRDAEPAAIPSTGDTSEAWRSSYTQVRKDPFTGVEASNQRRLRLMGLNDQPRSDRILDVGAGDGNLAASLLAMGFTSVVGVEYQPELLALHPQRTLVATGSATDLPFPGNSLHAVVVMDVLHHLSLEQLDPAVKEIFRVLVPGGAFYLCEPAQTWTRRALMIPLNSPLHRLSKFTRDKKTIVDQEGETYVQWLQQERNFGDHIAAAGFQQEFSARRWLHSFSRWRRPN